MEKIILVRLGEWGGWGIIQEIKDLYKQKFGKDFCDHQSQGNHGRCSCGRSKRYDPDFIWAVKKLREENKEKTGGLVVSEFDLKDGQRYRIGEEDGREYIEFDDEVDWCS